MNKKRKRARVHVGTDASGKPIYKWASASTKKELKAEKERILAEYTHPPLPVEPLPAAQTFREYALNWYALFKEPGLRASSRSMYQNVFHTHLLPAFGDCLLRDITANDLQRFLLPYSSASKSLIDKIMMVLRQVFDAAVDDDLLPRSPVHKLKPPEGTSSERIPLPLEDVSALIRAARMHKDGLLPLFLLFTGLRRGEALAVRWEDFENGMLHVRRAVVYEGNRTAVVGETKTKAAHRVLPVPPVLAELLPAPGEGYLFGGERVLPYTTFKRKWDALQTDIPSLRGVTPHRLRHTYLMLLRRAGVDPATQQYLMGHSDYETTANTYTHIDGADISEAQRKMNAALPNLLPNLLPHLLPHLLPQIPATNL